MNGLNLCYIAPHRKTNCVFLHIGLRTATKKPSEMNGSSRLAIFYFFFFTVRYWTRIHTSFNYWGISSPSQRNKSEQSRETVLSLEKETSIVASRSVAPTTAQRVSSVGNSRQWIQKRITARCLLRKWDDIGLSWKRPDGWISSDGNVVRLAQTGEGIQIIISTPVEIEKKETKMLRDFYRWSILAEEFSTLNPSSGVSDQQSIGSSPSFDTCVLKTFKWLHGACRTLLKVCACQSTKQFFAIPIQIHHVFTQSNCIHLEMSQYQRMRGDQLIFDLMPPLTATIFEPISWVEQPRV